MRSKSSPGLVENLVKALVWGVHRFQTDPAFGRRSWPGARALPDHSLIAETNDAFAKINLKEPPTPTDGGIRTVLEELVKAYNTKAKDALPADSSDLGVLHKLQDSGFLKQITGR